MACFIAWLLLLAVTFFGGRIILCCVHKTESDYCAAMVTGSVVLFFYMCIWQVVVVKLTLPFSVLKYAGVVYFTVVLLAGAIIEVWHMSARIRAKGKNVAKEDAAGAPKKRAVWSEWGLPLSVVLLLVLLVISVQVYEPYFGSDMTVEETGTILETGTICRYHPATGAELQLGMSSLAKLNFVPGLYAVLCGFTGADVYTFVCRFVPVWGLLLNYAAVCLLLKQLFGKEDRKRRVGYGMLLYGVLLLMGDYHAATYAFRLLHQGWNPGVILWATGSILLLAALAAGVRAIVGRKERRTKKHAKCVE